MIKALFFLKRKDGMTHEQFREHFENVHIPIADKYFTNLFTRYERRYFNDVTAGMHITDATVGTRADGQAQRFNFDCLSEWTLPDEETLEKILAMFRDPIIGKEFYDDEEKFLDREATTLVKCRDPDIRGGDR